VQLIGPDDLQRRPTDPPGAGYAVKPIKVPGLFLPGLIP